MKYRIASYCASFILLLAVWSALSRVIDAPLIAPSPLEVEKELLSLLHRPIFYKHFFETIKRCFFSFFLSVSFGTVIGSCCGISKVCKDFFSFPLSIVRSTPVVSIILLAMFWFNSYSVPVFVSFLMTFPIMTENVSKGASCVESEIVKMTKVYKFSPVQRFRWVTIPSIAPFFFSGLIATFGTTWKVIAAGEVLCLPRYGIGTMLHEGQVHLETAQVVSLTIVIIVSSFLLEYIIKAIIQHYIKAK